MALLVAALHRVALHWVRGMIDAGTDVPATWVETVLTVWSVDVWAPMVAVLVFSAVAVLALRTDWFTSGQRGDVAAFDIAAVVGAVSGAPLAVAALIGLIVVALFVLLILALAAAAIALLTSAVR